MEIKIYRNEIFASLIATLLSLSLLLARFLISGNLNYRFLFWNLFLSCVPLALSVILINFRKHRVVDGILLLLWLIFFPNAPYIITDIIHLNIYNDAVPRIFNELLLVSTITSGILLGFTSLEINIRYIKSVYGKLYSMIFFHVSLLITGVAIFIGRFLRWNSWDLVYNFKTVAIDLIRHGLSKETSNVLFLTVFVSYIFLLVLFYLYRRVKFRGR